MAFGVPFLVIILLVAAIWVLLEFKRMRHKFFGIFIIGLILFTYFGFAASLNGQSVNLTTLSGWGKAGELWFSWFSNIFTQVKSITAYAIHLNWSTTNSTKAAPNIVNNSIWNKLK